MGNKYIFVGINGGGSHGITGNCRWGLQIIRTARMEASNINHKWIVTKINDSFLGAWNRELQFYYNTKEILLDIPRNERRISGMPFGVGSIHIPGIDVWNYVPSPPFGHDIGDNYFVKIDSNFIEGIKSIIVGRWF